MGDYLLFLMVLLLAAVVMRGDFAFSVLYLFLGAYIVGKWWSGKALANVSCQRFFEPHAFWGEDVSVQLVMRNRGWLPVAWLHIYESLPVELAIPNTVNQVITLKSRGQSTVRYRLQSRKRGYFPIGPLFTSTGDLLGLAREQQVQGDVDHLTVFPKIIPLVRPDLPSRSPQGTLRSQQPIFEDPTRVWNKRDYVVGDSLRRIDWKASAVLGRLQIKQFEPSISLETAIFLDLHNSDYDPHFRIDSTELAIVLAASLASWAIARKQTVGLVTNGVDQLEMGRIPKPLLPRKGRSHLTHLLEILARLQTADTFPVVDLLERESPQLTWGTTVLVITGKADEILFNELIQIRKRGLIPVIILAGRVRDAQEAERKANHMGFPIFTFQNEQELDSWRQ